MKNSLLLGGIIAVALLVVGVLLFTSSDSSSDRSSDGTDGTATTSELEDPRDAVLDFFNPWHEAALSTTTDPQTANLRSSPQLSDALQEQLAEVYTKEDTQLDPVLCQATPPPRIGTRLSYVEDAQAEVHVFARGLSERSSNLAVVQLTGESGEWRIVDIRCVTGESAPEREFTFDREGHLLKNVPPPLNPDHWHLVFEQEGVNGYTAPLFFNESSICVAPDGSESVCDENTFVAATEALVQGEMTEEGVTVVRMTLLP